MVDTLASVVLESREVLDKLPQVGSSSGSNGNVKAHENGNGKNDLRTGGTGVTVEMT